MGEDIALIEIDEAAAHVTSELRWPDNLILVCSEAAHSPELNFIERVWEFIKQQRTYEIFTTLEPHRDGLQQVLEKITKRANLLVIILQFHS